MLIMLLGLSAAQASDLSAAQDEIDEQGIPLIDCVPGLPDTLPPIIIGVPQDPDPTFPADTEPPTDTLLPVLSVQSWQPEDGQTWLRVLPLGAMLAGEASVADATWMFVEDGNVTVYSDDGEVLYDGEDTSIASQSGVVINININIDIDAVISALNEYIGGANNGNVINETEGTSLENASCPDDDSVDGGEESE